MKPEGAVQVNTRAFQRWLGEGLGFYGRKDMGHGSGGLDVMAEVSDEAGILLNQRALAQQRPALLPQMAQSVGACLVAGRARRRQAADAATGQGRDPPPIKPAGATSTATPTRWC